MADFKILTSETIDIFAKRHYDNKGASQEEFDDDMNRFKYLKRLFRKYDTSKEFKSRLIINHIIVLANVFGIEAATTLLFFKVDKQHWSILKTVLIFLNYMPEQELIDIELDQKVMEELKRI
jgi:hypothetical protein|tara:strand:+ start:472 stop:837 length:366 start_codon:yes stop_codon:yes gene_type:complete